MTETEKTVSENSSSNEREYKYSKKYSNHKSYFSKKTFSNISTIILGVLVLALLIRYSQNPNSPIVPTFTSLLEKFATAEVPTVPFINFSSLVLGDWGAFNFLQVFIESIVSIFNVLLFFVNGIMSAISYIVWFMQWLFIG